MTVPWAIPVSTVLLKKVFICDGTAEVVISQSSGFRPRILSLMHPPTAYALKPCSSIVCIMFLTASFIARPDTVSH